MRIAGITTHEVSWQLDGTGAARGRRDRRALVVDVRTGAGARGLGEAAPLPGMSPDTLEDARRALVELAAHGPFEVELERVARSPHGTDASSRGTFELELERVDLSPHGTDASSRGTPELELERVVLSPHGTDASSRGTPELELERVVP